MNVKKTVIFLGLLEMFSSGLAQISDKNVVKSSKLISRTIYQYVLYGFFAVCALLLYETVALERLLRSGGDPRERIRMF